MGTVYGGPTNTNQWAQDLLGLLNDPITASNVNYLELWQHAESPSGFGYNPLGTEQVAPGSVHAPGNTATVQAYRSWYSGFAATLQTLTGNAANSNLLAALKKGNDTTAQLDAAQATPGASWAGGPETRLSGTGTSENFLYGGVSGLQAGKQGILSTTGDPSGSSLTSQAWTNPVGAGVTAVGDVAGGALSGFAGSIFKPLVGWIEEGAADVTFIGFGLLLIVIGLTVTFGKGASDEVNAEPAPVKDAAVAAVA